MVEKVGCLHRRLISRGLLVVPRQERREGTPLDLSAGELGEAEVDVPTGELSASEANHPADDGDGEVDLAPREPSAVEADLHAGERRISEVASVERGSREIEPVSVRRPGRVRSTKAISDDADSREPDLAFTFSRSLASGLGS